MISCLSESLVQVVNEKRAIFCLFRVALECIRICLQACLEGWVKWGGLFFLSDRVLSAFGFYFLRCVIVQSQKTGFSAVILEACLLLLIC
jgi:hypothetical protein